MCKLLYLINNENIWGWNYIAFRVVFQEIYAADKKIYATADRTGRAKYQLCLNYILYIRINMNWRRLSEACTYCSVGPSGWFIRHRARGRLLSAQDPNHFLAQTFCNFLYFLEIKLLISNFFKAFKRFIGHFLTF